jgi:glycosyltransferase involved in cell wall biosynthesis
MFSGALSRHHSVDLIGPAPARLWPPADGEVEVAAMLPGKSRLRGRFRDAALAATSQAELLFAFKAHPSSFGLGLWLRRRRDLPLAVHLDDWDGGYFADRPLARQAWYAARALRSPESALYLRLLERRVSNADLVTVSSRALQQRYGGRVIRQGVDAERFSPERFPREKARQRLGLEEGSPMVLFLGTPVPHKGLEELIAAVEPLSRSHGARLWIVGVSPETQAGGVTLGDSSFVEQRLPVPFEMAAWYLSACDVFVVPQRSTLYAAHQLPAKLLFAMALGACIVATDVGDVDELLGGSPPAGVAAPSGDVPALSQALAEVIENPERRAALSAESRRRAESRYCWEVMGRELDEEIAKLGIDG